jgi:hypothetical protein
MRSRKPSAINCIPKSQRSTFYLVKLSLREQGSLSTLADRFDCELILASLTHIFESTAKRNPTAYLKRCSDANAVPPAKVAIMFLPTCDTPLWPYCRQPNCKDPASDWWQALSPLRASWQLELTKLFWEGGLQLVDRPDEERPRRGNGRADPREREGIMRPSRKTWAQIAEDFNPPACKCFARSSLIID